MPRDAAALAWMANLACLELHPHPVRADDLDHPDELRVDLDPVPGVEWPQVREVARVVRATLDDFGLVGWPKTSGSRGMHVYVRIEPRWTFTEVRRAALALAREVERRAPALATSKWWKEERHGVFLDYNQNAKDRTVAARLLGAADAGRARVGAARRGTRSTTAIRRTSRWRRCRRASRRSAIVTPAIDAHACSLDALLELSARQEREGLGDAPWPPHYEEAGRRAAARAAVAAPAYAEASAVEIGRRAKEGRMRWPGSSAGRRASSRTRPRISQPADVLVDAMRGRFHTWTRIRVNLQHVPEALRPAQEPLDPESTTPRRLQARSIRAASAPTATRAEDLLELVRRRDLELIVAAVGRRLVGPPAQEHRRVAEAVALHVVVLHLAHALDAQRLPRQILAGAPAALAAGHARQSPAPAPRPTRATGCSSSASLAQRRELRGQLLPPRHRERRRHADVMQPARVVVEPEQQRADERPFPSLCQRKPATTQSAVRACLILIIARLPGS